MAAPAPSLHDLALQILEGGALMADKCVELSVFDDSSPGPVYTAPAVPGRSHALRLRRTPAPELHAGGSLTDSGVRGRLLHAMANHELQALELMALALLRFPDAHPRFRRGLAHVMADEQKHLLLYVRRMEALGVPLGALPMSDFFWRSLREMDSPLQFVVQIGLVLEQANLDFAAHWGERMRAAGDAETAAILDQVYAEEIGHVRHCTAWAKRWKNDEDTLWDVFLEHAREPLSPGRARGPVFDRRARERAGLPAHFIDRLAVAGVSRGRPPVVWWWNPTVELERAREAGVRRPRRAGKAVQALARDLQTLPATLATPGDVVLVDRAPRPDWQVHRLAGGLPAVDFVDTDARLVGRVLGPARPWGWSRAAADRARALLLDVPSATPPSVGSKSWALPVLAELLADPEPEWSPDWVLAVAADSVDAVVDHAARLREDGVSDVIVKGDWGASGQGRWVLRSGAPPTEDDLRRIAGLLDRHGRLTVGPHLDRVADLSLHGDVLADGSTTVRGAVRFVTDHHGRFRGALTDAAHRTGDRELTRFLLGDGRDTDRLGRSLRRVVTAVGQALARAGHVGAFGVDTLIHRTPDGLRWMPLVEVNPRYTFGRVALALRPRCARGGLVRLVRPGDGATAADFAPDVELELPQLGADRRLRGGRVWLTDPAGADIAAVLDIGAPEPGR